MLAVKLGKVKILSCRHDLIVMIMYLSSTRAEMAMMVVQNSNGYARGDTRGANSKTYCKCHDKWITRWNK